MPLSTSADLRTLYKQVLVIMVAKLAANENVDAETDELSLLCKALQGRGYMLNDDASDWVLAMSAETWKLQDDT